PANAAGTKQETQSATAARLPRPAEPRPRSLAGSAVVSRVTPFIAPSRLHGDDDDRRVLNQDVVTGVLNRVHEARGAAERVAVDRIVTGDADRNIAVDHPVVLRRVDRELVELDLRLRTVLTELLRAERRFERA